MKIKWQWFLGGKNMFWIATVLLIIFIFIYIATFIIDPTTSFYMRIQPISNNSIRELSEQYVKSLGVSIDKPIVYRFVKYTNEEHFKPGKTGETTILLGTFHEWNGRYYIDISMNLYNMKMLYEVVRHETRHMVVQELRNRNIIDLSKYTEEIAQENSDIYNTLFNESIKLLRKADKYEI